MLKPVAASKSKALGARFAIVASKYNARYVDSMVRAAQRTFRQAGASAIKVVRVPGAYEIPIVAARLAGRAADPFAALVCLGVIIRGETAHAQLIAETATAALMQIQLQHGVPVINEVLLLENEAQARKRCLDPAHNRGLEAAQTALRMASLLKSL